MLLGAAWAAWRQRAVLIVFSIAAATMFLLDAWFDVTTAGRDVTSERGARGVRRGPRGAALVVARRAARRLFTTHDLGSMPVRRIPLSPPHEDSAERS